MKEPERAVLSVLTGGVCCLLAWWAFWHLAPPTGIGNHGTAYAMLSLLSGLVVGGAGALGARLGSEPHND